MKTLLVILLKPEKRSNIPSLKLEYHDNYSTILLTFLLVLRISTSETIDKTTLCCCTRHATIPNIYSSPERYGKPICPSHLLFYIQFSFMQIIIKQLVKYACNKLEAPRSWGMPKMMTHCSLT